MKDRALIVSARESVAMASTKPTALLHCDNMLKQSWIDSLTSHQVNLAVWPDIHEEDYKSILLFICWSPPPEIFKKLTNLRAVQLLGAGVDSVISNPNIPSDLLLLRVADPSMGRRMATWVVWAVINTSRRMDEYLEGQHNKQWLKHLESFNNRDNGTISIGIMGLGVMGRETANALNALGFSVSGWTRSPKDLPNVKNFSGQEKMKDFVKQCEYLVCLLPLTPETAGIINSELLSWLPPGATVINGARGGHMIEDDVVAWLDDSGADGRLVTDVTLPEPLPPTSRLWNHPKVRLTPHVAAFTPVPQAAAQMAANHRSILQQEPIPPERIVDRERGY